MCAYAWAHACVGNVSVWDWSGFGAKILSFIFKQLPTDEICEAHNGFTILHKFYLKIHKSIWHGNYIISFEMKHSSHKWLLNQANEICAEKEEKMKLIIK